jgi:hypothetical protein
MWLVVAVTKCHKEVTQHSSEHNGLPSLVTGIDSDICI